MNLTTGTPLGPMPGFAPNGLLPTNRHVVARALAGRLPLDEIEAEIARQLDRFEAVLGRRPDFVDGHQHVHALPGIRSALLRVLSGRGLRQAWIRDPGDRIGAILRRGLSVQKALFVRAFSAGLRAAARRGGFDTNEGFSGFSPFDQRLEADVHCLFERAFAELGPRHLVMCHPGHPDDALRGMDRVVETRALELAYLQSDRFAELLRSRGVRLAPRPEPVRGP
jgi:predicted glycoside hydrolase/deacetylase ChbG (UPF0249 family)